MIKKFTAFLLCVITAFSFFSCDQKTKSNTDNGKLNVTVTFNAMKEFAEAVGKNKISVTTIIPDGMEPHDFEIKAKDIVEIAKAKVFIYNGMDMEKWADSAVKTAGNNNLIAVEASKGVKSIKNTDSGEASESSQYDPHVWISLKSAEIEVKNIEAAFEKADPENSVFYKNNSRAFILQCESVYNEYEKNFKAVKERRFVTGHAAFAYLCRDFGLTQNSVEDVFAEGEPSARQLKDLIVFCKKYHVKTIFAETMVSPSVSKTLASSVGAKVKTIYTIESSENGKSYLQRTKDNLSEIYESLS